MLSSFLDSLHLYTGEFVALMKKPKVFLMQLVNLMCIISTALMLWRCLALSTGSESPVVVVLSGSMEPAFHRGDILFLNLWREQELTSGDIIVFQVEGRGIPIVHRILNAHKGWPKTASEGSETAAIADSEDDAVKVNRERKKNKRKESSSSSSLTNNNAKDSSATQGYIASFRNYSGRFIPGFVKSFYRYVSKEVCTYLKLGYDPDLKLSILTKGDNNKIDDRGLYDSRQKFISRKEVMGRAFSFLPYVGMITISLNDYPWLKYLLIGCMGFFVMIGRETGGWL